MPNQICFVSPLIYNYLGFGEEFNAGGAERQQYLLARGLHNRGWQVSFLTRNWDDGHSHVEVDGFDVWKTLPDVRGVTNAPRKSLSLLNAMRRIGADVYYSRANTLFAIVGPWAARLTGSRFVFAIARDSKVEPAHLADWNPLVRYAFLRSLRSADTVVAQTAHQERLLRTEHGVSPVKIPNGYEVVPESSIQPYEDRRYVLWVGRIDSHQKKPDRYLSVAEALPDQEFVMVGPPNDGEENYYEQIRERANDLQNVSFVGPVDPEEIGSYYADAVALVNTSDYEGQPNTFIEAWQYGVPVISLFYDLGGEIESADIGYHSGSVEQLNADVRSLCEDVDLRRRLGENARRYVEENHSFDNFIDRYEAVFRSVL